MMLTGVISEGLHHTLRTEPLEAAKVSNARRRSSYLTVTSITPAERDIR
jgi:hypothetical protein